MSTTVSSIFSNCLQTALPCWFGDIPVEQKPDDKTAGDWTLVEVYKIKYDKYITTAELDERGQEVFDQRGNAVLVPKKFYYCMDPKGNLYNYWNGKIAKSLWTGEIVPVKETKGLIAAKFIGISLLTIPYILAVMSAHLLHAVYDVYRLSKKAIVDFTNAIKNGNNFLAAIINTVFIFTWKIPLVVIEDLWGVVRCPFFAVGMLFASALGICFPLEARRWYSKIESGLHQHARAFQYPYGLRMDLWAEGEYSKFCKNLFSRISWEKPFYLGWCMLKKGNIHQDKYQRTSYGKKLPYELSIRKYHKNKSTDSWLYSS